MKDSQKFFLLYIMVFGGLVLILLSLFRSVLQPSFPPSLTPLQSITINPPTLTETPLTVLQAVTTTDIPCYAGNNEYTITISPFVVVEILEKNSISNWVKVRVNDVVVCWVELNSLKFDINSLASVPVVDIPTPQIPTPTPLAVEETTTIHPLLIRWKILSYVCDNGKAVGATIDLDVSGGLPPYNFSPQLPIYARPSQIVSIKIQSNTVDGNPGATIKFTVPSASDTSVFKCDKSSNTPIP